MRFRSKKTEAVYRTARRPLVADLLENPVICPVVGCTNVATDPHEPQTRARGGSITDRSNVMAVCHEHNVNPPAELLTASMDMRHEFSGDEVGYLCEYCKKPQMSWRHR